MVGIMLISVMVLVAVCMVPKHKQEVTVLTGADLYSCGVTRVFTVEDECYVQRTTLAPGVYTIEEYNKRREH